MRQQLFSTREEPYSVRQRGVEFEGPFINPLVIDRENERLPHRFKHVNAQATRFGTRRFIDPEQLVAKCSFFAGQRLKSNDKVKRQALPPVNKYVTRKNTLCQVASRKSAQPAIRRSERRVRDYRP